MEAEKRVEDFMAVSRRSIVLARDGCGATMKPTCRRLLCLRGAKLKGRPLSCMK